MICLELSAGLGVFFFLSGRLLAGRPRDAAGAVRLRAVGLCAARRAGRHDAPARRREAQRHARDAHHAAGEGQRGHPRQVPRRARPRAGALARDVALPARDVQVALAPRRARLGSGLRRATSASSSSARRRWRSGCSSRALTESQVIAFFVTSSCCWLLWLIGASSPSTCGAGPATSISFISFDSAPRSVRARADRHARLVYFVSITVGCLMRRLPRARAPEVGLSHGHGTQERKPRPRPASTSSSSRRSLVVANILLVRRVQAHRHDEERALHALARAAAAWSRESRAPIQVDAYVTRGLPKLDAFVRDLTRSAQGVRARRQRQVRVHDHRAEDRRASARQAEGSRPAGAAVRRGERDRRGPGRDRARATWASSSSTAARRTSIPVLLARPAPGPRVLDHQQDPRDPRQGRQHQAQDRRPHRQGRDQAHRREPRRRAGQARAARR